MRANRLIRVLFAIAILGVSRAQAGDDGDVVRFRNGDALHGTVMGAAATGLQWHGAGVTTPIQFDLTNLAEVDLAPRPPQTPRVRHHALIRLTNGDQLAGDIVSLDETNLLLETWYAGRLKIKRSVLQTIENRSAAPNVIYSGPNGASDWQTDAQNAWSFRKGAGLYTAA